MSASISQYVLKVCSRCDLACDHCYVYEHADQSWHTKPKIITEATTWQAASRICEHARAHQLGQVHVVLHGGEPLLLGEDGLRRVVRTLRSLIDPVAQLDLRIHTNGVLLDESLCSLFADYGVKVGVSLDGDRTANDRHRRYADGRSSYSRVQRALSLLRRPEYRHLYGGILCTVDVRNDPIAVYQALLAEAPPRLDLLLPHATWDQPPPGPPDARTPYAAWLGRIHSRWVADGRPLPIRFFDSLLAAWQGQSSGSEAAGLDPVDLLVIETDGAWEQTDSLKTAYENAPATGLDIFSHSVDEAAAHPGVAGRQTGIMALCSACRDCPLVRSCGGGLYSHRYRTGNGFDNPSVYCDDLKVLIPQVITRPGIAAPSTPASNPRASPWLSERTEDRPPGQSLPEEAFELLSAGSGDAAAMVSLADAYWSVVRALVAQVASDLDGKGGNLRRAANEGWQLLDELEANQPEVVREVLTYPYVQAWAMRCLRPARSADFDLDRAYLAGLAAAAALRAGMDIELVLPVRKGSIYLPAIGAFAVEPGGGPTSVVRISPPRLTSRDGVRGWQTVRRVTAASMSVTVEDIDPFRDCRAWTPAARLAPTTWQRWRQALAAAARQLADEVPAYAAVMGAGLRSVVPMHPAAAGSRRSGTARDAFGALALALPYHVDLLGELLVHEMQHVKLTALCDLFDLFDRSDATLFPVPWRQDDRPVEGLLHGTYAHLAIADLWWARSTRTPGGQARQLFLMYRSWAEKGIDALLSTSALTANGRRFVNGMASTVEAWADGR
jgi:uncharacterized protein